MKKQFVLLGVLAIALIVVGCPMPTEDVAVSAFDLTSLVTAPVKNMAPVTTAINAVQYTGTVVWQTSGGAAFSGATFAAGTVYKALVTLKAKTGYTFTGVKANRFAYTGATAVSNAANSGTVTISFPATAAAESAEVVSDLALDTLVKKPALGGTPNTTPIDAAQYTGTIAWTTEDDEPFTATFAAKTVYKAVVTLTVKSGYTFTGVELDSFIYTGAMASNDKNKGVVTITFPELTAEAAIPAAALKLDDLVEAPVVGETPVTTAINTTWYTGTIAWTKGDNVPLTATDKFVEGTVYKAVIRLTAKTGYTFTGVKTNSFAYTGATAVSNAANSGTVTITFPAIATAADEVVSALDLTKLLIAPVKNVAPVTTAIDTTQYAGTVAWQTSGGAAFTGATFAAATVYKAVVTLTVKTGYTFTGVKANSFAYTGATAVSNAANSGAVTITFSATAAAAESAGVVSDLALDALVIKPALGGTPNTTPIDAAQYTGTIAWTTDDDAPFTAPATFAAKTIYIAVVTLTVKSGYTFTGVNLDSFRYTGAYVTNAAGKGVVTITFPELTAEAAIPAAALKLDDLVEAPVVGGTPVTTAINTTWYTGTIAWRTSDDKALTAPATFVAGTVYKAVVTLIAKSGYTFNGVAVNSFAYTGATAVSNAANSGVVIITFPATEATETAVGAAITVNFAYGEITITGDNGSNVISKSGASGPTSLSLRAEGYTGVVWYVDGNTTGLQDSGSGITLNAATYDAQMHSITFTGTVNGRWYSSRPIPFTVLN